MFRFSKFAVTFAALLVFTAAAVQQTYGQDDARCFTAVDLAGLPSAAINWKVQRKYQGNDIYHYVAGKPVTTKLEKCNAGFEGVKISIRASMKYSSIPYSGNVYDGQHLTVRFLKKDNGQLYRTVPVKDGDEIDWPINTFVEIDFQFPGFPVGFAPRTNRFAGSSITAHVSPTSLPSTGNRRIYTVVPLKGTSAENAEMLTKLGRMSWELISVDAKWAYLKFECPLTGGPAQCR